MNFIENFNVDRFLYSLQYMWQGMLGIFLVIAILIGSVVLMNKIFSGKKRKKNTEE